jgi:hypothetical protein
VLNAIGRALRFAFGGFFRWLYRHLVLPIGHGFHFAFGGWWPLAVVVLALALAAVLIWLLARRRSRVEAARPGTAQLAAGARAEDLERMISDATSSGDHETSVRLMFLWGVLRLGDRGVVVNAATRTDSQLAALVESPAFGDVQRRHERIVYGRAAATAQDVDASRSGWSTVLSEAATRRDGVRA